MKCQSETKSISTEKDSEVVDCTVLQGHYAKFAHISNNTCCDTFTLSMG